MNSLIFKAKNGRFGHRLTYIVEASAVASFIVGVLLVGAPQVLAASITSTAAGGNWNATTTWVGGVVPSSTDDVVIVPGASVTVIADATINSITFDNTSTSAATLTVNSGITLTVTTGTTLRNAAGANTSATIAGAGTLNVASVTVGGTTINLNADATTTLTSTIAALSISGNLNVNGEDDGSDDNNATFALASGSVSVGGTINTDEESGSTVTLTLNTGAETGTLTLSGSIPFTDTVGSPTFDAPGTGATVVYSRAGNQTVRAVTYRNLTLSGSGAKTLTNNIGVNGNLTLSGTATATTVDDLNIDGNLDVGSGATFTVANNDIDVNGTTSISGTLTVNSTSGTKTFDNITINTGGLFNSTVNETYSLTSNLQVDGTGSITSGTGAWTFSGAGTLSGTGSATITNAEFATSYSNSGTFSFSDLYVQGSGTVNFTNNGTITVTNTLTGNDNFVQGATSILNYGGSGTITPTLTATAVDNTVNYNRAGIQTVKATTYSNLIFSGSGAKSMATGISTSGNLSIAPSGSATASVGTGLSLTINSLTLGGLGRINGTWGSTTATTATNQNNTYFAPTTGRLTVTTDTRATPTATLGVTNSPVTYTGSDQAATVGITTSSVPGAVSNTLTGGSATKTNAGTYATTADFVPDETTSYKTLTGVSAGDFIINPRAVVLSGSRTYDASTGAASGILSVLNKVGSDDVTVASGSGTLASANVGSRAITSFDTLALGGTTAGNYTLADASGAVTISKADQTVTFGALADKTYGDDDFSVSATASSGLEVTFTASGDCGVIGSTVHITASGSCTITAHQTGDTNYNAATDVPQSFTIAPSGPISGTKYSDLNANGTRDDGEPGLSGWTINLSGQQSGTTTTDSNGDYSFTNLPDGSYTVCEVPQTGWQQTAPTSGASCAGDTFGFNVTMSNGVGQGGNDFGNVELGSITISKATVTNNTAHAGQAFSFSVTGPNDFSFDGQASSGHDIVLSDLLPGGYVITEVVTDGWDLTSATCGVAEESFTNGGTYAIEAGEITHCTFTNTEQAILTINKVIEPNSDAGLFNLQIDSTTAGTGANVGNGGTTGAVVVSAGSHTIGETAGTGTDLSDYTAVVSGDCESDGSVTLAAGDSKVCTITNTKKGTVIVKKMMVGSTGTFEFTGTPAGSIESSEDTLTAQVTPGQYVSTETVTEGWDLTSVTCDDSDSVGSVGNANATFNVAAGETVTCTFTNTRRGSIHITKVSSPDGGPFTFTLTPNDEGLSSPEPVTITTIESTGTNDFTNLKPGSYQLSESAPEGQTWEQSSVSCTVGDTTVVSDASGLEAVTVPAGGVVSCTFNNTELGSISGMKFEDSDINGENDDESGLESWHVVLTKPDDEGFESQDVSTDEDGAYVFANLQPGTYRVCEVLQEGWHQSAPRGESTVDCGDELRGYDVTIGASGLDITGRDFGNYQDGSIAGTKFSDRNGNGGRDEEPGLAGWTIYLDLNDNSALDEGEPQTTTAESGYYSLSGLTPGNYVIREIQQEGWQQTYPEDNEPHRVSLASGSEETGVNFGNQQPTIKGLKFEDRNADGQRGEEDLGVVDWKVALTKVIESVPESLHRCVNASPPEGAVPIEIVALSLTGSDGQFSFFNVPPGQYRLIEQQRESWENSTPGPKAADSFFDVFCGETLETAPALDTHAFFDIQVGDDDQAVTTDVGGQPLRFGNVHISTVNGTPFSPTSGDVADTDSVVVVHDTTVDISVNGNTSTVTIPEQTVITTVSGSAFDATALASGTVDSATLSGLGSGTVVGGALHWGITNLGLQFSQPITVSIFVGTSHNGQTLSVLRSVSGAGDWTNDGIAAPGTCVVTSGLCTFQTTRASFFAATSTPVATRVGGAFIGVNFSVFPGGVVSASAPVPVVVVPAPRVLGVEAVSTAVSTVEVEQGLVKSVSPALTNRLRGRILIQTESHGEAWYVDQVSGAKYYLSDGAAALVALKKRAVKVSQATLKRIPVGTLPLTSVKRPVANTLRGRILVIGSELWHVNPVDGKRYAISNANAVGRLIRAVGLGVSNNNLRTISVGK